MDAIWLGGWHVEPNEERTAAWVAHSDIASIEKPVDTDCPTRVGAHRHIDYATVMPSSSEMEFRGRLAERVSFSDERPLRSYV